jgi:hypothetical protein
MPIPVETAAGSRDQRQDVFGSGTPCASGTPFTTQHPALALSVEQRRRTDRRRPGAARPFRPPPHPSTGPGRRTVQMPGFVVAALRAHLGDRQPVGLAFGKKTGTRCGGPTSAGRRGRQRWSAPGCRQDCASTIMPSAQLRDLARLRRRADQRRQPTHGARADQHDAQPPHPRCPGLRRLAGPRGVRWVGC